LGQTSPYALVIAGIVFAILIFIGYALFVLFPTNDYYFAMLLTGILAVVMGVVLYLASALSRGSIMGMASVGSFWFGIAMLLGAAIVPPNVAFNSTMGAYDLVARLPLLIFTLVIAVVGLACMWWQSAAKKVEATREDEREAWRRSTGVVAPGEGMGPRPGGPK